MEKVRLERTSHDLAVLTPEETARADGLAIGTGISGGWLMENAGQAVKSAVLQHYPGIQRALVLCGPGNNGGDGYVAARLLNALGIETIVYRSLPPKSGGDAAAAAERWTGPVLRFDQLEIGPGDVVVDALYGAGFRGRLQGVEALVAERINAASTAVVAVDLPSGLSGLTGRSEGPVVQARQTVAFFRKKPGHLLFPGRALCGQLHVADIGIGARTLDEIQPALWENGPGLFERHLPMPLQDTHKYERGHAGVFSGGANATGAARLAAMAAARIGAGAVTMFSPSEALAIHAAHLTSVMLKPADSADDVSALLRDERLTSLVLGPAFGRHEWLRQVVGQIVDGGVARGLVLDADVFSAFALRPTDLFTALASSKCAAVMTPHQGEFERMFPDIAATDLSKVEMARTASRRASSVIVHKGPDTVIATPDGRAAINTNGGPELATAGSGDVLAGMIAGLLAQGMPAFEAACAAVWMHGEAGKASGLGAVAEDFVRALGQPSAHSF